MQERGEIDAEIRAAVWATLRDWSDPNPASTERFLASVTPTFTGHGTGPNDFYQGKEKLRAMVEREQAGISYAFRLDLPQLFVQSLGPDTAVATGALTITVDVEGEAVVEVARFSFVFQRGPEAPGSQPTPDAHRWLLAHFHFSVPDAMQEHDGTMDDYIDTRTRHLEAQVAERTDALAVQTDVLRTINETNAALAVELDLDRLVQRLADAGRELVGAEIGAFFYNVQMREDVIHTDYAISGIDRSAFAHYPIPRMTDIFRPTFMGEEMLRIGDVLADPRYGGYDGKPGGMPSDHPPVRSFLSAPIQGRDGTVLGGFIFGHPEPDQFTPEHEALLAGVADQAAIAITNARLFEAAQREIDERRRTEAALAEARDRADTSNRAKSAFLASMSHELRTPLNGILGYAQLIQRDADLPETHRASVRVIEQSGRHLLTLINDVLDLAKIEAGKLEVETALLRLPELLRTVSDLARVQAETKGLAFVFEEAGTLPLPAVVLGDGRRLRQVLLNLLGNAVKFTERGHIALRARAAQAESNEGPATRLILDVEDTGIGIAPEQAATIFEPFEQAPDAAHASEGTGLGLAISQHLVRTMGGRLTFESEPGAGSRFTLDLVLPVLAGPAVPRSPERRQPNRRVVGHPRVLVVDDKAVNRSLLVGLLGPLGFEVVEAENGLDALHQAEATRPVVVLMDLVMPVLDGFEATRRLRAMPGLETVPIVALSASAFSATERKSLALGCDAFLPKPVEIDVLLDTLDHLLDLTWVDGSTPAADPTPADAESDPASVAPPTPVDAAVLYDLALRGDVQRLRDALDAADQHDRPGAAFRAQLRALAVRFRMQEIRAAIEPHLNRDQEGEDQP